MKFSPPSHVGCTGTVAPRELAFLLKTIPSTLPRFSPLNIVYQHARSIRHSQLRQDFRGRAGVRNGAQHGFQAAGAGLCG